MGQSISHSKTVPWKFVLYNKIEDDISLTECLAVQATAAA
jgi:hypothetical protein